MKLAVFIGLSTALCKSQCSSSAFLYHTTPANLFGFSGIFWVPCYTATRSCNHNTPASGGWKQLGQGSDPCAWGPTGQGCTGSSGGGHSRLCLPWPMPLPPVYPQKSLLPLGGGAVLGPVLHIRIPPRQGWRHAYSESPDHHLADSGSLGAPLPKPLVQPFKASRLSKANSSGGLSTAGACYFLLLAQHPKPLNKKARSCFCEKREERKRQRQTDTN